MKTLEAPGLEFHVHGFVFDNFSEASAAAVLHACTHGDLARIDVITWDREAAIAYGGDDAGEQYDEDPEASVFERIEVRINNLGRVP